MSTRASRQIAAALVVALLSMDAWVGAAQPAAPSMTSTTAFPRFPSIAANVEFWKRVFSEWSLGQVIVHDLEFPAVVYDVVDLPGPVEERYTEDQRDFIDDLSELWKERLRILECKADNGDRLDDEEKAWALQVTTHAGSTALTGAATRVRTQRGQRERFRRGLEISGRYDARIRDIFREAGLPDDLAYLPHVESSFQATARSSAGAVGVWQFTRSTGRRYLKITSAVDERLDPIAAARGAAAYLADAYAELGSWPLALTAYNHGVAGMRRAAEKLGGDYERILREYSGRLFGFASKNFYSEFLAAAEIAVDPAAHFPGGVDLEPPLELDALVLEARATPARLARAHGLALEELVPLNPGWSARSVRSGLALPAGITVWLPQGTHARLDQDGVEPDYTAAAGWIDEDGRYVVQPGDTLSVIAETYGVPLSRLRRINEIPPGSSLIRVGQHLQLDDAADETVHVVRGRETLSSIAQKYGMPLDDLRRLNGLAPNESLIRVGQRLRVHDAPANFHVVRPGETLLRIALVYGVKLSDLLRLNRLTEQSVIQPGQKIRIPFAS